MSDNRTRLQSPHDLSRAEEARARLDRQCAAYEPRVDYRERRVREPKDPLPHYMLRFFKWFRVLPIAAMALCAAFTIGLSKLPLEVFKPFFPLKYEKEIRDAAKRYDMDPYLIASVIYSESGWDANAKSSAGAEGLMQIMPSTAEEMAQNGAVDSDEYLPDNLFDPATNIEYGVAYFSYLEKHSASLDEAIAAYNAGPNIAAHWNDNSKDDDNINFVDAVEYPETKSYIERVNLALSNYKKLYEGEL